MTFDPKLGYGKPPWMSDAEWESWRRMAHRTVAGEFDNKPEAFRRETQRHQDIVQPNRPRPYTPVHEALPAFQFPSIVFPDFPQIPEYPQPRTMPLPDDAAILAAKRRKIASRRGGRTATMLSQDPENLLG